MNRLAPFYLALLCFLGLSGVVVAQLQIKPPQRNVSSTEETQTKTAKAFFAKLIGDWKGSYSLWLRPGTPAHESDINANFQSTARGNYFLMIYSWQKGDQAQEGVFLFGGDGKAVTATWGDSFHMVPEPMQNKGELQNDGKKLIVLGSYSMGDGPAWGLIVSHKYYWTRVKYIKSCNSSGGI